MTGRSPSKALENEDPQQIRGCPIPRFPVEPRGRYELHAPFLRERRTRGTIQRSEQEIRGISLVFREMWDTTSLNQQLYPNGQPDLRDFPLPLRQINHAAQAPPIPPMSLKDSHFRLREVLGSAPDAADPFHLFPLCFLRGNGYRHSPVSLARGETSLERV
jgi:hypothetical protein